MDLADIEPYSAEWHRAVASAGGRAAQRQIDREERQRRARVRLATTSPERLSASARKGAATRLAATTPEQRRERARKGAATRMTRTTPEQRRAWARLGQAALIAAVPPERLAVQRAAALAKAREALAAPAAKSARSRKSMATYLARHGREGLRAKLARALAARWSRYRAAKLERLRGFLAGWAAERWRLRSEPPAQGELLPWQRVAARARVAP